MSEEQSEQTALAAKERSAEEPEEDDDDDVSSPFDHPYFLPVLLWALAAWFGWDGWINQDPEMREHLTFNRGGFAVLSVAAVYFTVQAVREKRAEGGSQDAGS